MQMYYVYYVCLRTYGTNHIKLNVLRVRNGRTRTRSIPERDRLFIRRVPNLTIVKMYVHLRMYVVIMTIISSLVLKLIHISGL